MVDNKDVVNESNIPLNNNIPIITTPKLNIT